MEPDTNSRERRVVPASDILGKIEHGENVEYNNVIIKGDLGKAKTNEFQKIESCFKGLMSTYGFCFIILAEDEASIEGRYLSKLYKSWYSLANSFIRTDIIKKLKKFNDLFLVLAAAERNRNQKQAKIIDCYIIELNKIISGLAEYSISKSTSLPAVTLASILALIPIIEIILSYFIEVPTVGISSLLTLHHSLALGMTYLFFIIVYIYIAALWVGRRICNQIIEYSDIPEKEKALLDAVRRYTETLGDKESISQIRKRMENYGYNGDYNDLNFWDFTKYFLRWMFK